MSKALEMYKKGDWNDCKVQRLPDGSDLISLTKESDPEVYQFRVKNLNKLNEVELDVTTDRPTA